MEERSGAEPDGQGRRLSRSANARAPNVMRSITRLIELRESADEQIATVASKALWEILWGKPQDYDPAAEQVQPKPPFDPSLFSIEELKQLQAAMTLIAVRQGLLPPEAIENAVEPTVEENRDE